MTAYVAYCRVSSDGQGRSGLGLEAQETTIRAFLKADDRLVLPIMVEVESGRRSDRPVLRKALDRCRVMNATLIVAKLDRLARDAAFIGAVRRSGIPVVFCDMAQTHGAQGDFVLGVMAHVAQLEAGLISERTKAALAALKARGKALGGDRGYRHTAADAKRHGAAGGAKRIEQATVAALSAADLIDGVRQRLGQGASLNAVATALNDCGASTPRGGRWTATAVKRALARIETAA